MGLSPILKGFLNHCEDFSLYPEVSEREAVERPGQFSVTTDKCNQARDSGGSDQTWKACLCLQQLHLKLLSGVQFFLQIEQSRSKENLEHLARSLSNKKMWKRPGKQETVLGRENRHQCRYSPSCQHNFGTGILREGTLDSNQPKEGQETTKKTASCKLGRWGKM